ncbi:MAG: cobalt ECF transporter T component CbiQ [Acidimicrobiia bacterium]
MGAGHVHALYVHEHSLVHKLAPEVKLVAAFGFVLAVALTPREALWAFAAYGVLLVALLAGSRFRPGFVLARMMAVLPFVLFAFLIPFIASGERVELLGVAVSREGLWGMWNIVAKASLGITVSILLAGTTEVADMLRGMGRLCVPALLTTIASFMVRYLELISSELGRMRVAMTSRGYDPRWLWQARPLAASAGALFIRSYERGERVHAAMLSRGYTGTMPDLGHRRATRREWLMAAALVLTAGAIAAAALVTR